MQNKTERINKVHNMKTNKIPTFHPAGKRSSLLAVSVLTALILTACGVSAQPAEQSGSQTNTDTEVQANMTSGEKTDGTSSAIPVSSAANNTVSSFTVTPMGNNQNTITVNSSETVTVVPDIAQVVYAVRTEAKDAAGCQKKNTEDVDRVIALLKNLGVAETSIQTSDYTMYPIYNYSNNTQRITGYEATASLTVSDLPISDLGNILTESVNAGINNIQSITYQSSRYDESYTEALKLAVESARIKAEALAAAGGCTLGGVAGIRENSNYSQARYTNNALASQMRAAGAAKEMSVEDAAVIMPGEVEVEVNITVEYFIP